MRAIISDVHGNAEALQAVLEELTAKLHLKVMEGNKVIEIRVGGTDKGQSARRMIDKHKWDFILAIGDDVTDEDTFAVLPAKAHSIKVGFQETRAEYRVDSVRDVRVCGLRKICLRMALLR